MTEKTRVPIYSYTADGLTCEVIVILTVAGNAPDWVKVWTPFGAHYVERAALVESPVWREFNLAELR